ncbi:MAG: serine/threonine protein kinase [Candidatus Melainabacteria bacterium]|nr:MAG: serine/threonine protein kinase [Candidatus Melainabacteria bacterium]
MLVILGCAKLISAKKFIDTNISEQMVGSVFNNRYEITELLGEGHLSKVYKARHCKNKTMSAIKIMHPDSFESTNIFTRFQHELKMTRRFNHQNVVGVQEIGLEPKIFMIMEYVHGVSLATVLQEPTRLPYKRSLSIFKQICDGLNHIHKNGVVHRDIKPSNIMLLKNDDNTELVKIVDFGIAKVITHKEALRTTFLKGGLSGSPYYMSSEQCQDNNVDARSDIYALGCLMYKTLTGHQPITGHDALECLQNHISLFPKSFACVCPEISIPKDLEDIILRCLAKERENRFQSADELKRALESVT